MMGPRVLLAAGTACLLAVLALALAAHQSLYFGWDPPVTRAVQSVPLGPFYQLVPFYGWLFGVRQVALAAAGVVLVFVFNRWGGLLMAGGALSAAAYQVLDLVVHRPRPDHHLVHVVASTPSNSFPSGHTAFFTWFSVLLVLTLGRRSPPPLKAAAWVLAVLVIVATGFCRVWAGAHWPSDVLAGFLLGAGWTLLVVGAAQIWAPEGLAGKPGSVRALRPGP